jgi:hypothetical protein
MLELRIVLIMWGFNLLKPSDYYMHHKISHSQIPLPAPIAFMFLVCISEQTAIISLYSIDWLDFITEAESVYCTVRAELLCVLCGTQNKQRLFPYTALTDWFL